MLDHNRLQNAAQKLEVLFGCPCFPIHIKFYGDGSYLLSFTAPGNILFSAGTLTDLEKWIHRKQLQATQPKSLLRKTKI